VRDTAASSRSGSLLFGLVDAGKIAALLLVAVLLQVTVATDLVVFGGYPDLVVLVVVSLALLRGPVVGAVAGFAGGLGIDILGLGVLGTTSLTLVVVGYAIGAWGERVSDTAPVRPLLAIAVGAAAAAVGELIVAVLVGSGPSISASLFVAAIPRAMLDMLLGIALYPLIRRLMRRPRRRVAVVHTETAPG
jgi:rod shape-determining protein MreD